MDIYRPYLSKSQLEKLSMDIALNQLYPRATLKIKNSAYLPILDGIVRSLKTQSQCFDNGVSQQNIVECLLFFDTILRKLEEIENPKQDRGALEVNAVAATTFFLYNFIRAKKDKIIELSKRQYPQLLLNYQQQSAQAETFYRQIVEFERELNKLKGNYRLTKEQQDGYIRKLMACKNEFKISY